MDAPTETGTRTGIETGTLPHTEARSGHRSRARGPATRGAAARRADERGITTAEYAVGTAAGAGLAGVLYKLVTGGYGDQMLRSLFDHVLGLLGVK